MSSPEPTWELQPNRVRSSSMLRFSEPLAEIVSVGGRQSITWNARYKFYTQRTIGCRTRVRRCSRARVARPQGSSSVVFLGAVAPAYRLIDRMTDSLALLCNERVGTSRRLWHSAHESRNIPQYTCRGSYEARDGRCAHSGFDSANTKREDCWMIRLDFLQAP